MKLRLILPFLLMIAAFTACNLDNTANTTPTVIIYSPRINGDSVVGMHFTDNTQSAVMVDSLHVGDTISMLVVGDARANNLTEFNVVASDTTAVKILIPDSIEYYVASGSIPAEGKFLMKPKTVIFYYPLTFIPRKPVDKMKFTFKVTSDAVSVPNESAFEFSFPIKPKRIKPTVQ